VALFAAVAAIVVLAVVPWARQRSRQVSRQVSTVR
jgi:lipopolysaccharide export LptBFGC system permease protein LptF